MKKTTKRTKTVPIKKQVHGKHSKQSSLREKIIEHKFLADLLEYLWCHDITDIEIGRAEVDNSGYDLVISINNKIRFVQLKSSIHKGGKFSLQKKLWDKPGAVVIFIRFKETILGFEMLYNYCILHKTQLKSLKNAKHSRSGKMRSNVIELTIDSFKETNIGLERLLKRLWGVKK